MLACGDYPVKRIEYEHIAEGTFGLALMPNRAVDILFVIDDSSSMAEEQAPLSANFEQFIRVLERPEVQADYRIEEATVPPCEADRSLPADRDVCYVTRVGDELDPYCVDSGYNVEFELLRRDGVAVLSGTLVTATCELSPSKSVDCPDLP